MGEYGEIWGEIWGVLPPIFLYGGNMLEICRKYGGYPPIRIPITPHPTPLPPLPPHPPYRGGGGVGGVGEGRGVGGGRGGG